METVELGGIVCAIVRRARRSVAFRVSRDGTPEIHAPMRISAKEIEMLMLPYSERIAAEYERQKSVIAAKQAFTLDFGSTVRLLGAEIEIRPDSDGKSHITSDAFYLPSTYSSEEILSGVIELYKKYAREYITERVAVLSKMMKLSPIGVRINSAMSHWGSCSRKGTLNFSWFCIMASPDALDYIIVHELCHMYEFNHSPRFWAQVGKYVPDYKHHRDYLKALWRQILSEKWGK